MIIWSDNLLRPDLEGYSREELIRKGRFSATKPQELRKRWPAHWFVGSEHSCLERRNLEAVHTKRYIDESFEKDDVHAEYALATCNTHLSAALQAIEGNTQVLTPVSGFHHASRDNGWGFCTFNGLMLTADEVLSLNLVDRVVILDGDTHYGDGCRNILTDWVRDDIAYYHAETVAEVEDALYDSHPKRTLVLYQAGVDGHFNDPLRMGEGLTDETYRVRDELVYDVCNVRGWPSVTNLAGGYTEHSLDLYTQTAEVLYARSCS